VATLATLPLPSLDALEKVQHLDELDRFQPAPFISALQADLGNGVQTLATLSAQLDGLHEALLAIEPFTRKAMGIRLTHVLAAEPVPPQLRTLLSATVVSYASDMPLLRRRFGRSLSAPLLDVIISTAERVLALRQALRDSILDLVRRMAVAHAQAPWLKNGARNGSLQDAERFRLRLATFDLQKLAERPEELAVERFEARLKKISLPDEESQDEDANDATDRRFSLLEVD
jgi:hypothetical protein